MKKIYSIFLLTLCVLIVGCSSDDNDSNISTLKVIKTEAEFSAKGGTGTIEVQSVGAILATTDVDWCKVQVTDNIVNLTVETNKTLSSRAALIAISSGNETTSVPVTQMGDIAIIEIADYQFPTEGGSITFGVETERDFEILGTENSWITSQIDNGKVTLTAASAPEATYRELKVSVKIGGYIQTATFSQMNLVGEYAMLHTRSDEKRYAGTCVISATTTPGTYILTCSGIPVGCSFLATFENNQLKIPFGQMLGTINPYYIYLCAFCLSEGGYLNPSSSIIYAAEPAVGEEGKATYAFHDTGTWSGYPVEGIFWGGYNNTLDAGGKYAKNYGYALDVVLVAK